MRPNVGFKLQSWWSTANSPDRLITMFSSMKNLFQRSEGVYFTYQIMLCRLWHKVDNFSCWIRVDLLVYYLYKHLLWQSGIKVRKACRMRGVLSYHLCVNIHFIIAWLYKEYTIKHKGIMFMWSVFGVSIENVLMMGQELIVPSGMFCENWSLFIVYLN